MKFVEISNNYGVKELVIEINITSNFSDFPTIILQIAMIL